jgi:hypothetical protein
MATQAQMEANRRNAAKSTGPTSEAGKARTRHNALRHGITAKLTALSDEDRAAYDEFTSGFVASLQPEGDMELHLANSIADASWRLDRTRAIDTNLFALDDVLMAEDADPLLHAALAQARAFRDNAKTFGLLSLYEQRLNRTLHRDLSSLHQLQTDRRAQQEEARRQDLEQALLLKEFNEAQGLPFNPAVDCASRFGFVFSAREIDLEIFRRDRRKLPQALIADRNRTFGAAA